MSNDTFISESIKQNNDPQFTFFPEYHLEQTLVTICAYLNSDGGWIIVGHSGTELIGIKEESAFNVDELENQIAGNIIPQPLVYTQLEKYNQKYLLLINVLKGSRQPYSYIGKNFIRVGDKSVIAGPDDIGLLIRKPNKFSSSWEKLTAINVTITDLDLDEITKTIELALLKGRGKSLPKDPENFLSYFQLFDFNSVKNGAFILFGKDPIKHFPQCRVRITVLPYGKAGSRYDDSIIIEENLVKTFEQVQNYFTNTLPVVSSFKHDDWSRLDRERYPREALDEAVVNALVHRDYGDISGEVIINIFRDRIEITNSGEMPDGILKAKVYHPVFRNPMIVHMFYLRGSMEKTGRGLTLIRNQFDEYGYQAPEWITENGYTSLTLYSIPKLVSLNERMLEYLKTLKTGVKFTREDYEKSFNGGISEKTARNDLLRLVESGLLSKIGLGPSTKYVRTNKELPDITV